MHGAMFYSSAHVARRPDFPPASRDLCATAGFIFLAGSPTGLSDAKPHVDIPEIQSVEESCAILSNMKPQVVIVGGSGATEHRNQMIAFLETCRLRRIDVKLCFEFIDINMSEEIDNNSDFGPFLRTVPVWSTFVQRAGKWILDQEYLAWLAPSLLY